MQSVNDSRLLCSSRMVQGVGLVVGCVFLAGLSFLSASGSAGTQATTARMLSATVVGQAGGIQNIDPATVVEAGKCMKCHEKEVACAQQTKHSKSLDLLKGANAAKYQQAAGGSAVCAQCHGTPTSTGVASVSVSCQSCHGGARDWLEIHDDAEKAPDMRAAIHKKCDAAGMIRAGSLYEIARNCFECHVVSSEKLVNAGHPASNKIEFVGWSSGEVRHNFQLDKGTNALAPSLWIKHSGRTAEDRRRVKYVVGLLVDMEVTLRNLTTVINGKTPYAKAHAKRLKATFKDFEKVVKALGGGAPEAVTTAHKAIDDMGRISSINFKGADDAKKALPIVQQAAQAVAVGTGEKLQALDKLIDKECKPKGDVFGG